jgi:hypothetical protein
MKKTFLLLFSVIIFLIGCSSLDIKNRFTKNEITIHFKKPESWPHEVYIYYYKDKDISVGVWPGVPMVYEKHDWYVYTISENWYKDSKVMFFGNDDHRIPLHLEPGFSVWDISNSKEVWFYKKKWYNKNPE